LLAICGVAIAAEWDSLKGVDLSVESLNWIEVLSDGWAAPLKGFMREKQYLQVLHYEHLITDDGYVPMALPIVLPVPADLAKNGNESIALRYKGRTVAILDDPEYFEHRKEERIARTFGLMHQGHPYVNEFIFPAEAMLVGGDIRLVAPIEENRKYADYRLSPAQLRDEWKRRGADAVFVFQLRNPIHNGHALLMKKTYDSLRAEGFKKPVLWLSPIGGWTKDDDVPLDVRLAQHEAIIKNGIFGDVEVVVGLYPSPMLYAGPREVQWHARGREIAGATHYIVGRDPAGMKHPALDRDLYAMWDGQHMLQSNPNLNLTLVPFQIASYDTKAKQMAIFDPSRASDFLSISGTKMRKMAKTGEEPPPGFMDPDGWNILKEYYMSMAKPSKSEL